ncbi:MAG TPA: ribonuclease H [Acidimicrobiales bacterium]|nr:ribonuclease H [Acidimicrobiales bacterium]
MTRVYTDGACIGNPGPGGWAWAVPGGSYASGPDPTTTNQRMEVKAALEAVLAHEGPLEVVSDSTYVVKCFNDRWWEGWVARGWTNKARQPVANRDLWEPLISAVQAEPGRVRFTWVKGHSADVMNDLVDRLAVEAARTQEGRRGDGTPELLGPADLRAAGGSARVPASADAGTTVAGVPEGHLLLVAGLRPPGLGGYGPNDTATGVRRRLAEILTAKRELHADLVVLSGMGLGAEQLAVEAAAEAGVPYVAVLAFPDQDAPWPADVRRHFRQLLDGAQAQVLLQATAPATRQGVAGAMSRRDTWLARHAAEAVVVWDGADAAVGRAVRTLKEHLGEEEVWVVEPSV